MGRVSDEGVLLRAYLMGSGGANVLSRLVSENRHSVPWSSLLPLRDIGASRASRAEPFLSFQKSRRQGFFHVLCGERGLTSRTLKEVPPPATNITNQPTNRVNNHHLHLHLHNTHTHTHNTHNHVPRTIPTPRHRLPNRLRHHRRLQHRLPGQRQRLRRHAAPGALPVR